MLDQRVPLIVGKFKHVEGEQPEHLGVKEP